MWFRNRQDEGVVYVNYFQPIKVETIALVLAVVSVFPLVLKSLFLMLSLRLIAASMNG